ERPPKHTIDVICNTINTKCGEELETKASKLRSPKIIIFNVPEEINTDNIVEALTTQNVEMEPYAGIILPKYSFQDRKKNKNVILELTAEVRKQILGRKLKIGWHMCNWDDHLRVRRCAKCCKFNHYAKECHGNQICPNCTTRM
ncbi:hypothetical protein C0J52_05669, partial [Blattella germanica]